MIRQFQSEFKIRKFHLKLYLAVLAKTERASGTHQAHFAETRLNVLRAGTFLILYNLVEASARNAVEAIHEELVLSKTPFQLLNGQLKRQIIKGFRKHGKPDIQMNMVDVPVELVAAALQVDVHFSGNVDARLIRELGEIYGFSTVTDRTITRNGANLLSVKNTRNDLAHGIKSYDEIGREYTSRNLLEASIRTSRYVEQILNNISAYLDQRCYLATSPSVIVAA